MAMIGTILESTCDNIHSIDRYQEKQGAASGRSCRIRVRKSIKRVEIETQEGHRTRSFRGICQKLGR